MDQSAITKRIDQLLQKVSSSDRAEIDNLAPELAQGCVSMLSLVYGPTSSQVEQFTTTLADIAKDKTSLNWRNNFVVESVKGALTNLKGEIELGLIGDLIHQIAGEVLTDMIQLARSVLDTSGNDAKNVAAVLSTAAFEDTIRRMGKSFAGVVGKDDLAEVLKKLKDAAVMKSPQVGIAQSYLSFRNHALHANWENIQRESVHSVLGFVEQLLIKHFS